MSDVEKMRQLAASRGYALVKGQGRVVGKRDYGKFGLKNAKTGAAVFGFGNRSVTASIQDIERYLNGGGAAGWDASLRKQAPKR